MIRSTLDDSTIDGLLSLLASRRRRLAIRLLESARGEWMAVSTLADRMEDRSGGDSDAIDGGSALIGLHHVDLPKLADAGVVEYDPFLKRVRYRGGPAERLIDELLGLSEAVPS